MPEYVLCLKCGAKWLVELLLRKGVTFCHLCHEPGLRYMNANGQATEETFPRQPGDVA